MRGGCRHLKEEWGMAGGNPESKHHGKDKNENLLRHKCPICHRWKIYASMLLNET